MQQDFMLSPPPACCEVTAMARHGGHVVEPQPYHLATMLPQHDKKKSTCSRAKGYRIGEKAANPRLMPCYDEWHGISDLLKQGIVKLSQLVPPPTSERGPFHAASWDCWGLSAAASSVAPTLRRRSMARAVGAKAAAQELRLRGKNQRRWRRMFRKTFFETSIAKTFFEP